MISVECVAGPFGVAVLRLSHDLLRLALHARDRLEWPGRVPKITAKEEDCPPIWRTPFLAIKIDHTPKKISEMTILGVLQMGGGLPNLLL